MRIAERQGYCPGDLLAARDVLVAAPTDIVGRVANAEDGIEQQLDRAAAGTDDQIGLRDGVDESVFRLFAQFIDSEQQTDADGNGKDGQEQAGAPVPGAPDYDSA